MYTNIFINSCMGVNDGCGGRVNESMYVYCISFNGLKRIRSVYPENDIQ